MAEHPRRARLPDFLILGAQRGGTTSLFASLAAHPEVAPPKEREIHFFNLNYWRGSRWYRRKFRRRPGEVSGESSPYYLFHPHAPPRVAADLPSAKFVVLLRDPVEQIGRASCRERV